MNIPNIGSHIAFNRSVDDDINNMSTANERSVQDRGKRRRKKRATG